MFERGGVNFSHVTGERLPPSATAARPGIAGRAWEAMGVSLVLHPRNPYAPTVHMNVRDVRRACADSAMRRERDACWWFGGGMDLTPYYGFEEDAIHFHRTCRDALAPVRRRRPSRSTSAGATSISILKHRSEPRGVGGIFFDDLDEGGFERCFALTQSVGDHFLDAYVPILERRKDDAVRRARARLPGVPPRPLRRVQPRLGPRHAVRPAVGRPHRGDPDVAAAARASGATTGSPSPARRRRGSTPIFSSRRIGSLATNAREARAMTRTSIETQRVVGAVFDGKLLHVRRDTRAASRRQRSRRASTSCIRAPC